MSGVSIGPAARTLSVADTDHAAARTSDSQAQAGATGANGGDADNAAATSALDARIRELVAKATTPEDEELERQREQFDFVTRARAELERETNALRDLAMEQMKHDDELLKKWIALI